MQIECIQPSLGSKLECISSVNSHCLFFSSYEKDWNGSFLVYSDFRERERKRAELKSLKSEYKPGVWNVNSVLLGGLGNEPDVNGKYFPFVSSLKASEHTIQ